MTLQTNVPSKLKNIPPIPEDLPSALLTANGEEILSRRYLRKGDDGNPIESIDEMFWRVAYNIAEVESQWSKDVIPTARKFYTLLSSKKFFPNSPTFTGAGTPLGQLAACFVLPVDDDMGRLETGIFSTLKDAALIQQTGGGNGFSFSRLRPSGSIVKSSSGEATGPIGFLRVYDHAFGEVAQGGTRRGANMAVLRVDHPDIEAFIACKTTENAITNFNISVGITDAFMVAVENDEMWDLRFPDIHDPGYRGFHGTLEQAEKEGVPIVTYSSVRARDLFEKIVRQSHHNGEPGVLFLDAANRSNPLPHLYQLEATNPCGEQWLGPYENCCLGSINLAEHFLDDDKLDWSTLKQSVELATQFLDDVVDANKYVPAVPKLKDAAQNGRRIGLGIMGLADLMYHLGIRYGSEKSLEIASQVMEFIRFHTMSRSIQLATERGAFPGINGSIYDPDNITWEIPASTVPYNNDWGRPDLDWDEIVDGIQQYGIRNAAQTTIAPTGTISTVAGCEGYGCEPVFALAYVRHVNDNGSDLQLTYSSPLFNAALKKSGISPERSEEIVNSILQTGTCQDISELPEDLKNAFVVSQDIKAEEHVRIQAALQAFVDNSLSKTINFPSTATENDVAIAYKLAWENNCKGITVYVTGSRDSVVLETQHEISQKEISNDVALSDKKSQLSIWYDAKKPRPKYLHGYTHSVETPLGKAFITINENGKNHPFELFLNTAKAGSNTASVSEAIGRLISYILRISSPIEPKERLWEVVRQLSGIGGGRPLGFGPNRVLSLPDGVARVLEEYLSQRGEHIGIDALPDVDEKPMPRSPQMKIGDICPECGQAALVNEEGCRKCYGCGFSEC